MHRSIALALIATACTVPPAATPAGAWQVQTAVVTICPDGAGWLVRHDEFRIDDSSHGDFYRLRSDGPRR